ncbi:MAG TPA: R3H domain-containing nucleic acid-binding protein [Bryobacteraceae bacterium]|nr:R3H domain-containing nucleic acid-binding protein [Bryobacteraceae bacterium]
MDAPKYTVESVSPRIRRFLSPLLARAGLRLQYQVTGPENRHPDFENPDVVVRFSGPDVELLLANRAELLLALEHLTMEMLRMPPEDHSRLCFDANDYRALRIEELRLSALAAAEKVKRTGRPFEFNPMTSRERRIIHLALRGDSAVRSESSGLGSQRKVVIYPADMPPRPEEAASARPPVRKRHRR